MIAGVAFARDHDLPLAVRGGGHNGGGLGTVDDGARHRPVADCATIAVDPATRTVRVEGGATWGDVDHATHAHGLAVPGGIISTTGVGGLTLGGGIGHLTRSYGLTIDNLLAADVVLADGSIVTASADDERGPLLGAPRRRRQLRRRDLVHVPGAPGPTVVGGPDALAARATRPRCSLVYREFMPTRRDELDGFFAFLTVPPGPPFPEELHLRKVCGVVWCYTATTRQRRSRRCALVRDAAARRGRRPMPLPALQQRVRRRSIRRATSGTGAPTSSTRSPTRRSRATWSTAASCRRWKSTMHLYPIDGAAARVGKDDTRVGATATRSGRR